ncbi:hypothetical protein SAMN05421767_1176 [Granulicatella balaenopterae]|uniref:Prepilin-type N-terminal cleavage/methylation domain-containing protein n=1 Tax=Granulicatella balaenopterae TaxID=137733 RepID=A0A1H9L3L7_9LACT|nr:prepilin-type N-terminal cleavage/methylation domain-containing protein [Granulicatella balaenopterae]SER05960.1 hypothetical protein SAMN05421767_1176 [Granulicatella balaenopterae]
MKLPVKKQSGFTLIEQIIALGVFMLCLVLLMTCMQLIKKTDQYLRVPDGLEWHLAMVQLHDITMGMHFEDDSMKLYSHNPRMLYHSKSEENFVSGSLKISGNQSFYFRKNDGYIALVNQYRTFSLKKQSDCIDLTCEMPWKHTFEASFTPATHAIQLEQIILKKKVYKIKPPVDSNEVSEDED